MNIHLTGNCDRSDLTSCAPIADSFQLQVDVRSNTTVPSLIRCCMSKVCIMFVGISVVFPFLRGMLVSSNVGVRLTVMLVVYTLAGFQGSPWIWWRITRIARLVSIYRGITQSDYIIAHFC